MMLVDISDLKRRRKALGLSQERLAGELGVIKQTVYRWETGRRAIPVLLDARLRELETERRLPPQPEPLP